MKRVNIKIKLLFFHLANNRFLNGLGILFLVYYFSPGTMLILIYTIIESLGISDNNKISFSELFKNNACSIWNLLINIIFNVAYYLLAIPSMGLWKSILVAFFLTGVICFVYMILFMMTDISERVSR